MRKVFWDTMLFVYLLGEDERYFTLVEEALYRSRLRGDKLFTSTLAVGEVLAGVKDHETSAQYRQVEKALRAMRFELIAFNDRCIPIFSQLRSRQQVKAPDAIHLACAGAEGMDMFLTNDRALQRVVVPGVKFIGGLEGGLI